MKNKTVSASPVISPDDYECRDALRTIQRAHEIMKDPKMMERVKAMAADHVDTMKKIARAQSPVIKPRAKR